MQIFVLEDDSAIGMGLTYSLENEGYALHWQRMLNPL